MKMYIYGEDYEGYDLLYAGSPLYEHEVTQEFVDEYERVHTAWLDFQDRLKVMCRARRAELAMARKAVP